MTIEERIAEILKRADAATKGPWENDDPSWIELNDITVWGAKEDNSNDDVWICNLGPPIACCGDRDEARQSWKNGEFIAHARMDVPRLCRALQEAVEWVRLIAGEIDEAQSRQGMAVVALDYIQDALERKEEH